MLHTPTRLGGLFVTLLLLAGSLAAQSSDTLREGEFRLQQADASALLTGGDQPFSVTGSNTAGQPSGDWQDDVRQGEGVFYDKDGEVVARGRWEKDELVD